MTVNRSDFQRQLMSEVTADDKLIVLDDDGTDEPGVVTAAGLAGSPPFTSTLVTRSTLTTDGDILTRTSGVPARISRADLATDTAFSSRYAPLSTSDAALARTQASGLTNWYGPDYADLVTFSADTIGWTWAVPIVVPVAMTIDRVACEVTTGGAGSTCRLGLYEWSANPNTATSLIADGGTVDTSTTGAKEATISVVRQPGIVMAVVVWQSGSVPTLRGQRGGRHVATSNAIQTLSAPGGFSLNTAAGATGAFPASLAVGQSASSVAPRLAIRGTIT